jgi:hypothetical protein
MTSKQFQKAVNIIGHLPDADLAKKCITELNNYSGTSMADLANRITFDECCITLQQVIREVTES